ncbi:acetate kinase [Candidatus Woesearchaeota archaeon]|nr:acetate kinase [Candidatus Woesearchaeota archaeon]
MKKILVINSGSSSLKYTLYDIKTEKKVLHGHIDGIGLKTCKVIVDETIMKTKVKNHHEAVKIALHSIDMLKKDIVAIGHRVVHGGEDFSKATLVNPTITKKIKDLSELAPLHNPANLAGIQACKKLMPKTKQIAVFDTAFHQSMPPQAYRYAIPEEFYKKYKVRRYGFHGTSHKYIAYRTAEILETPAPKTISCHLGNGASICAIKDYKSIDTSMGFTPLEGLIMGTRSGDIDPEAVVYLAKKTKKKPEQIIHALNKESGLLALGGFSDVRILHDKAAKGNKKAQLALDMFVYRILKYIGDYDVILEGADAIVFTAGIGEGAWYVREKIAEHLKIFGVELDYDKNRRAEYIVSTDESQIKLLVIPTNEELQIMRECKALLKIK